MNNTPLRVALCFVFALAGACGSQKPTPKPAAIPVPNLGLVPMPSDISGASGNFRLAANTDVVYSGGEGAASAAAYFVEIAVQQKLVALSKASEGTPGRRQHRLRPRGRCRCGHQGPRGRRLLARRLDRSHHHHRAYIDRTLLWRGHALADHHREASAGRVHQRARAQDRRRAALPSGADSCSIPRVTISRRSTSSSSSTGWRCTSSMSFTGISPTTRRGGWRSRSIRS